MDFKVTIDKFEGPLDLMLHLIKENELDLFDLNIDILCDQYLLYLESMEQMHLEVVSEYLVELATLIEYKSKKLLPKDDSKLEEEYEEDPKVRLMKRLMEYQKYKEVTKSLEELYLSRECQYTKPVSAECDDWINSDDNAKIDGNPYELVKAMKRCLRRMRLFKPIETKYTKKEVSMEERSLVIRERLVHLPKTFTFETLIDDCKDMQTMIVTFLVVLDMSRTHILSFTVDEKENIWFSRG